MNLQEIPKLDDWMTLVEIAKASGISRQAVDGHMRRGTFESVRRIGSDTNPFYVVSCAEAQKFIDKHTGAVTEEQRGTAPV